MNNLYLNSTTNELIFNIEEFLFAGLCLIGSITSLTNIIIFKSLKQTDSIFKFYLISSIVDFMYTFSILFYLIQACGTIPERVRLPGRSRIKENVQESPFDFFKNNLYDNTLNDLIEEFKNRVLLESNGLISAFGIFKKDQFNNPKKSEPDLKKLIEFYGSSDINDNFEIIYNEYKIFSS
ncbi:unnamed protein product [Brachionus calyciflorus]|uniref:Uncharacterized protein n=1 Tax=Brachionus calyciflorus TaxID=104777 RepID=A0A813ZC97_9BILA|nr:unnamed protein product [Brachionus calyciflorus]